MKICHITNAHNPFDIRIFHKECRSLVNEGYDVTLIAQHKRPETVSGVKIVPLPKAKNRLHRILQLPFKAFFLALKQRACVYHFHDPELIPIALLLKLGGNKVIYDVHEDVPRLTFNKEYIPKYLQNIVASFIEKFEKFSSRRFNAIVAATPLIADRFFRFGCRGINVNNFPILNELCLSDINWSQKERAICYIGGISPIRGIFHMVKAIESTDAKLLLAGTFQSEKDREQAAASIGWGKVQELGQIGRSEVRKTLSRSMAGLVLLHPVTKYLDSLPIKMFEYMSAGIPIIASNFPLWKAIIEGNNCGICVDPMDPGAISQAIQWIVDHPDEGKQMGENGRKAVKDKYNWETEGEKLLNLYKQLFIL